MYKIFQVFQVPDQVSCRIETQTKNRNLKHKPDPNQTYIFPGWFRFGCPDKIKCPCLPTAGQFL